MPKKRVPNAPIQDEFTALAVSRTRKMQLRRVRDGLCHSCGKPRGKKPVRCAKCMEMDRQWHRLRNRKAVAA